MDNAALIQKSIMQDMTEGVMTIGFDGVITYVNPAAARILGMEADFLTGRKFARCFFEYPENDGFNQTILDAVYDSASTHRNVVPYFTGSDTRQLHVTTSYLHDEGKKVGIIAVLSDISELTELRDAVKAMHQIRELNHRLELRNQLLSETFGRFLSDEIVRQLLDTPDGLALGGKKRVVTILMSDLRGFTAMSETMAPQDLITMLNHYLGQMTDVIQSHSGTIIEFIGDGILAVFGAPAVSDRHAQDAAEAAVAMQRRMEKINAWNAERGFPALEMGIGVHTGEVIVGNIGSEKRTKYGVVGSHVNLCGRIESYTVGGQILISPETRAMLCAPVEILREMEVCPKGVSGPLVLSQLTGIGDGERLISTGEAGDRLHPANIAVSFRRISEKHISRERAAGTLTAVSGHQAMMTTDTPLALYENLSLQAGGELLCKVVGTEQENYQLRFTSVPGGFHSWLRENIPEL